VEAQVGISLLIISLKTEVLRHAFCCDGKKEKEEDKRDEEKES
jgi:hypothetical protein